MITALVPSPALDVTYLLDAVADAGIHRPREVLRLAGGKGLNLARAARMLDARVRVVAPLGGVMGELIARLAEREGFELDAVPIAAEARQCVSAIPAEGAPTEFYEPAPLLTPAELSRWTDAGAAAASGGWTALCGSLPAGMSADELAEVLATRRDAGDRVAVDSSGAGLRAALDGGVAELIKVNRTEAAEVLGARPQAPASELAAGLLSRGARIAVVTDGAAGAVAMDADGAWHAVPDPLPGRFAIGSGDSFLAGLLVALDRGDVLPDALLLGSAVGSANTRRPGAGVLDRADVDAAATRIRVESMVAG